MTTAGQNIFATVQMQFKQFYRQAKETKKTFVVARSQGKGRLHKVKPCGIARLFFATVKLSRRQPRVPRNFTRNRTRFPRKLNRSATYHEGHTIPHEPAHVPRKSRKPRKNNN
jgi:hypothetical protein